MANWKKLAQGAAGAAGAGGGLNVEDVFSTYLYKGTSANQSITNGVDLSTEGGLVWVKNRDNANDHVLVDTERGALNYLHSSQTYSQQDATTGINTFNTDGFDVDGIGALWNNSSYDYASWTFRKAPKFFDVVTYTGDGVAGKTISHNLGATPGAILIKCTSSAENWRMWHTSFATNESIMLNSTGVKTTTVNFLNNTSPTSTTITLGNHKDCNANGDTYVMYLFAHNDGDGGFGPTGDQDIIKCGSYTGNGTSNGTNEINLGFEPQWLLIMATDEYESRFIIDSMRGISTGNTDAFLEANASAAEATNLEMAQLNPNGFSPVNTGKTNKSNKNYIYIAIRRGPMAVPTDATDVFAIGSASVNSSGTTEIPCELGHPVDFAMIKNVTGQNWRSTTRLTFPKTNDLNNTDAESNLSPSAYHYFDNNEKVSIAPTRVSRVHYIWGWRRAPSFFDVVAYKGTGSARTINHNLGVKPDMMWFKKRNSTSNTSCWHKDLTSTTDGYILIDQALSEGTLSTAWNNTEPTASNFSLGTWTQVNQTSSTFICYLFASLSGVSKVGTYSGNGGTSVTGTGQDIDCGFSSGARFVIIKALNADDHWFVYDTTRGIVAGNDATFFLNLTTAQSTTSDEIDPLNSGFTILNGNNQLNRTGRDYIFYAIA